jgi:photosystem II stability/assembly factor-like uncharacterized protein
MNTPDLETRIRSYYRAFEPDESTRLALASASLLEDALRPQPRQWRLQTLRLAATLAAAALLAVLLLPRFAPAVGPKPATGSPGPTFDARAATSALVDQAGLMRSGGVWAVQGSYLLTSTDNGVSWRAGTFPSAGGPVAASTVFVLDPNHAWAIDSSSSAGSLVLHIARTSDGGRTWQSATFSGDYPCDSTTISFVDAAHGFVMCSVASSPGPNGSNQSVRTQATKGSGTVLRTDDGGATWSVAGGASGLGRLFTASDPNTLWSAPDYDSSTLTGPALYVSHDAGRTWSTVELPGLALVPYIPAEAEVGMAAGPVFWDASNGVVAVGVFQNGSGNVNGTGANQSIWFYRTSDAGKSWVLVKQPTMNVLMMDFYPSVLTGREWAAIWLDGFEGLTTSSDFGASWSRIPWSGMPPNSPPLWLDFTDKDHAFATVFAGPGSRALMVSTDDGRSWHPADFGDARAKVPADATQDPATAKNLANDFAMMATKDPPTAWTMLSPYSQQAFGSESQFATAQAALNKRANYQYQVGEPAKIADLSGFSQTLSDDLTRSADMSRAYAVAVSFPGITEPVVPTEEIVVAPLSATGEWRVWAPTP